MRFDTPTRLRLLLGGVGVSSLALVALLGLGVSAASDGLDVVGHGAGPRVAAANELYGGLAGMDAELANVLLVGDEPGLGFDRKAAVAAYAKDRDSVAKALQRAAEDAVDASGRAAVANLVEGLAEYENLAGQVILLDRQADARPLADRSPALPQLREATDLMHDTLLPEADCLLAVDARQVEDAFDERYSTTRQAGFAALFVGVAMIGLVTGAQMFLFMRTHRVVNPGLAAATVVAVVLVTLSVGAVFSAAGHLRVAKRDSFDSVLALTRTKAVAADANGDESRFLVDPDRAARYQEAFLAKSQQLATLPGADIRTYDAALAAAERNFASYARGAEPAFRGELFGREFRNVTFAGEREAAEAAFRWYVTYQRFDRQMRVYAEQDRQRAIDFNTSYHEGNSNWSYDHLQKSLDAVVAINRSHMDRATRDGEDTLAGWAFAPAVGAMVIGAAAYTGTRPRLREYRGNT